MGARLVGDGQRQTAGDQEDGTGDDEQDQSEHQSALQMHSSHTEAFDGMKQGIPLLENSERSHAEGNLLRL